MKEKRKITLLPKEQDILTRMGERIKLARLRRNLSVNVLCERANISRATLWKVENGDPGVAIGIYLAVLHGLQGMDKDFEYIAKDDILGKTIQDLNIHVRKRAK